MARPLRNKKAHFREEIDRPDLSRILALSEKALGPDNRWVVPIAILVAQTRTPAMLRDIGEFFSLSVSGVSNARSRAREAIRTNSALARAAQEIEKELTCSSGRRP